MSLPAMVAIAWPLSTDEASTPGSRRSVSRMRSYPLMPRVSVSGLALRIATAPPAIHGLGRLRMRLAELVGDGDVR